MTAQTSPSDRAALRVGSNLSPAPLHRRNCRILLWAARGVPVARIAKAFKVSRPLVYRLVRLWTRYRDPALLDPRTARRFLPWRADARR